LLGIITVGTLIVYLLYSSGNRHKYVIAELVMSSHYILRATVGV